MEKYALTKTCWAITFGAIAMANDRAGNAIDRGLVSFDEIRKGCLGALP
jgi:hypothetical protein